MSDAQNTVTETPEVVAPVADAPATEATTTEAAATTEAPAATETPAAPTTTAEAAKEITPATDGILGYKGPGLVKGLRFAKRYFYFTEDPTEAKSLSVFIANEKSAGHPTAAWASQTGKGLLFFAKRAEDKATPTGIFNLSEISDVTKEGSNEFLFKLHGQKHVFQASSTTERDSWIAAIEAQVLVATAEKETITSGEGYKAELEKLTKPASAAIVAAVATKKTEEKKEDKKDDVPTAEADSKRRSQSRKRASIFGSILGKKDAEEKKETKEDTKDAAPAEAAAETPAPAETAEPTPEATTTETPEAPTTTEAAEDKKEEDVKKEATKPKRASIFGTLFQKVASPTQEKPEREATVASTAPQLDNPVQSDAAEPIEPEAVTGAADAPVEEAPKETENATATASASKTRGFFSKKDKKVEKAEKEEDATAAPAAPAESTPPKEKRRTSLFGTRSSKKEKKSDTSDAELTEGETKSKNKLGGLFRRPSKAVKVEGNKGDEAPAATDADTEANKPEPISKDEPAPVEAAPAVNGESEAPVVTPSARVVEATA